MFLTYLLKDDVHKYKARVEQVALSRSRMSGETRTRLRAIVNLYQGCDCFQNRGLSKNMPMRFSSEDTAWNMSLGEMVQYTVDEPMSFHDTIAVHELNRELFLYKNSRVKYMCPPNRYVTVPLDSD